MVRLNFDRRVITFAFDVVADGCQPLLAVDDEARSTQFLNVYRTFADVDLREGEPHQNRVDECLLVLMCPNELSLEVRSKYEFAFVDQLIDIRDSRIRDARFDLQWHLWLQPEASFSRN